MNIAVPHYIGSWARLDVGISGQPSSGIRRPRKPAVEKPPPQIPKAKPQNLKPKPQAVLTLNFKS